LEPVNEFAADEDMYAEYDDTMYPENDYETYDYEEAGGFYEYWWFLAKGLPEALLYLSYLWHFSNIIDMVGSTRGTEDCQKFWYVEVHQTG